MHYLIVAVVVIALFATLGYFLTKPRQNIQQENRPDRVYHEEECPICLENKTHPVQASCAHEFCGNC